MKRAPGKNVLTISLIAAMAATLSLSGQCPARAASSDDFDDLIRSVIELNKSGKAAEAEKKLREVLPEVRKDSDAKKEFDILITLGQSLKKQARLDEAETSFKDGLALAENSKLGTGRISSILADLGKLAFENKKYDVALEYYKRSVDLLRENVSRNNPVLGSRLIEYAEVLEKQGKQEEAAELKREGEANISEFLSLLSSKAKANWHPPRLHFSYKASVYFEVGNHGKIKNAKIDQSAHDDEADQACIKAIESASPLVNITWKDAYERLFLDFSFDYNFMKDRELAAKEQTGCTTEEPTSIALTAQDDISRAKARIAILKSQLSEVKNGAVQVAPEKLTQIYIELGEKLTLVGEQKQGIELLQEALATKDFAQKDAPARLILLSTLANIKVHTVKCPDAEPILKEVIDSPGFDQIADPEIKKRTLTDYGHVLCNLKRYAEAQQYFNRATEIH